MLEKQKGVYNITEMQPVMNTKEIYFYVNKDAWCQKYKDYIINVLYEIPIFLVLDTNEGNKLMCIPNVSEFKENYKLMA